MPQSIDPAIRLAAVADVQAGAGIRETARKYGVSHVAVAQWSNAGNISPVVSPQKRIDFGVQLSEYLEANLNALTAQVRLFTDREWLAKQPANDLAVLHGVIADKSIRLLTALQRSAASTGPGDDTAPE